MLHTSGIGKLRPNCVLFGFPTDLSLDLRDYEQMLRVSFNSDMTGVMILRDDMSSLNVAFTNKPWCHTLPTTYRKVAAKNDPAFGLDSSEHEGNPAAASSTVDDLAEVEDLPFVVNGEFVNLVVARR